MSHQGPKSANSTDVSNYRPISIIPGIAKVFGKIIFDQFHKFHNNNEQLTNCQSGFRAAHGTITALLKSTNEWRLNIDRGLINGVVFIDLKKAFDSVDHSTLIAKLRHYGLTSNSLNLLSSYLENRRQRY